MTWRRTALPGIDRAAWIARGHDGIASRGPQDRGDGSAPFGAGTMDRPTGVGRVMTGRNTESRVRATPAQGFVGSGFSNQALSRPELLRSLLGHDRPARRGTPHGAGGRHGSLKGTGTGAASAATSRPRGRGPLGINTEPTRANRSARPGGPAGGPGGTPPMPHETLPSRALHLRHFRPDPLPRNDSTTDRIIRQCKHQRIWSNPASLSPVQCLATATVSCQPVG